MMEKLAIYCCVALLPLSIYANVLLEAGSENVMEIAEKGGLIEDVFQPTGDKPLGIIGRYSFAIRGIFHPIPKEIAMKFTPSLYGSYAKREYEMYSYLNATADADVERFGIPSVYYYGRYSKYSLIMLGISLFDQNMDELLKLKSSRKDVNILIILRDFILSSKYMHSCGVRHDDIKFRNVMVRQHRIFLTDFILSSKMNHRNRAGTNDFASRRAHEMGKRYPKDDWESFLYSICHSLGATFKWIEDGEESSSFWSKNNINETIDNIENIHLQTLKNILVTFAKHVFDDGLKDGTPCSANESKWIPDYDCFYGLVNEEIEKLKLPPPVVFTWLTDSQRKKAMADLEQNSIPHITDIKDPKEINFVTMEYPDVDFSKFTDMYKDWKPPSHFRKQDSTISDKSGKKAKKGNWMKKKIFGCSPFGSSKDATTD